MWQQVLSFQISSLFWSLESYAALHIVIDGHFYEVPLVFIFFDGISRFADYYLGGAHCDK